MRTFGIILRLSGFLIIFLPLLNSVLNIWGYSLTIQGSELPQLDWEMTAVMVVTGALFLFFGFRLEKKYAPVEKAKMQAETRQALDDNAEFIYGLVKKSRRNAIMLMIIFGALSALFVTVVFADPEAGMAAYIVIGLLALICLGLFVMALMQFIKNFDIKKSPTYVFLVERPHEVTGVVAQFNKDNQSEIVPTVNVFIFSGQKRITNFMLKPHQVNSLEAYLKKRNSGVVFERR